MAKQLFIGLVAEGCTDIRFLQNIVQRTFEDVACKECTQEVEILTYELQKVNKGNSFPDLVENAALEGVRQLGAMTIVVHTDSDCDTYEERFEHKFKPAIARLESLSENENYCTLLTPLIAVRMIESWMLADKELFKSEINTCLSDSDLGIARNPETMSDPKQVIVSAIKIAAEGQSRRRSQLSISELYGPLGAKISLNSLNRLSSYKMFRKYVVKTFQSLHYL